MPPARTFEVFGLVIHGYGWDDIRTRITDAASRRTPFWIVTANPEIMLAARRDPSYWQTIRQADLRTVDGAGLEFVGRFLGASPTRLRGVDLAEQILALSQENNWKVAFLGGREGVADKAAWNLRRKYPRLHVDVEHGGSLDRQGTGDEKAEEALHRLTMTAPDVLLVAFGHPKQERWIMRHLHELPSVKLAIGVGGTFDYWAGAAKEPPAILRFLRLEWFWRLLREPRRLIRILNAVVIFPFEVVRERVIKN